MTYKLLKQNQGSISIFVMMFGTIASILTGGIILLSSLQFDSINHNNAFEQALSVAESGIHYYRWHLAHSPDDYTDGTGLPGPYVHQIKDTQGDIIGSYSLEIDPPDPGSSVITIKSTGSVKERPNVSRTVTAKLGIPSLARYAFLHNSSVFFGSGITVHGPVLSNGGIRQDGINDSIMQSSLSTYTCGRETGCIPSVQKPAIWGSGGSKDLWEFPVPPVDFNAVSISYPVMKTNAQDIGVYYGPSGRSGYHLIFRQTGTVDVYRVNRTTTVRGIAADGSCVTMNQRIDNESLLGNYSLNDNPIFFFEDYVWVEGAVKGRTSVVAARFPLNTNNVDIWINRSIRYESADGTNSLGLIAQRNIYFVRDLPNDFEVHGALLAQNGNVFRHGYYSWLCGANSNAVRNSLTLYGSLMGGQASAWNWDTPPVSGFRSRNVTYDNHLYLNPPPFFPVSQNEGYEFISWSEGD